MATKNDVESVKPIILKDSETGNEYTLEFSRDTVRFAEGRGFDIEDVGKYPMTKIYELFWYAFRMHHMNVSKQQTDKIIDDWGGIKHIPDGVMERLGELYSKPFATMTDKEAEVAAKNAKVTVQLD